MGLQGFCALQARVLGLYDRVAAGELGKGRAGAVIEIGVLDRGRGMVRQAGDQTDLGLAEDAYGAIGDEEDADEALGDAHRGAEDAANALAADRRVDLGVVVEAVVVQVGARVEGPPPGRNPAAEPAPEPQAQAAEGGVLGAEGDPHRDLILLLVDQHDVGDGGAGDDLDALDDRRQHGLQVEVGGKFAGGFEQRLQLPLVALGALQLGVVAEHRRRLSGEVREQLLPGLRTLGLAVGDQQHALQRLFAPQRDPEHRSVAPLGDQAEAGLDQAGAEVGAARLPAGAADLEQLELLLGHRDRDGLGAAALAEEATEVGPVDPDDRLRAAEKAQRLGADQARQLDRVHAAQLQERQGVGETLSSVRGELCHRNPYSSPHASRVRILLLEVTNVLLLLEPGVDWRAPLRGEVQDQLRRRSHLGDPGDGPAGVERAGVEQVRRAVVGGPER